MRKPKNAIMVVIVSICPEKSAFSPVCSLTSMPDALKINSAATENNKITAVDIMVAFQ